MEVSFSKEIESLRLGGGQTFHGEGILAITKALEDSKRFGAIIKERDIPPD